MEIPKYHDLIPEEKWNALLEYCDEFDDYLRNSFGISPVDKKGMRACSLQDNNLIYYYLRLRFEEILLGKMTSCTLMSSNGLFFESLIDLKIELELNYPNIKDKVSCFIEIFSQKHFTEPSQPKDEAYGRSLARDLRKKFGKPYVSRCTAPAPESLL